MISRAALELLQNPAQEKEMLDSLASVKNSLGSPGAAERAARLILDFLQK